MGYQATMRRCLEECDVQQARALWRHIAPHLPQPRDDTETLITIHYARTQSETIAFRLRAYSHAWLTERDLPSGLPDEMRPRAQRIYPRIAEAVGIAVKSSPHKRELGNAVRKAMGDAVMDCYANGDTDPELVKARMQEARQKVYRGA